jgi:predicted O-linked N-acetylglucosamine transferase (SPINDLY family)
MTVDPRSIKDLFSDSVRALRASKHQEAVELTEQIIAREADHAGAHAVQFSSLFKSSQFERARGMGRKAASLNPRSVFILNNQACLQLEAKQPAAAAGLLKSLIDEYGEKAQWLYNLALAQRMVGNYDYAIDMFRRTLDHEPRHDFAAYQLADCLSFVGDAELAIREFDYVRLLRSKHSPSHCDYIRAAVLGDEMPELGLQQEMHLWAERFIPHEKHYPMRKLKPADKISIGLILSDLPSSWLEHTVAPLAKELIKAGDRVNIYSHRASLQDNIFDESITTLNTSQLSDSEFAKQVRTDAIDVIIDLCGMRAGNRQRALGLHLASRQFAWLGHEGLYATDFVSIIEPLLGHQRFGMSHSSEPASALPDKTFSAIGTDNGASKKAVLAWSNLLRALPDWSLHFSTEVDQVQKLLKARFAQAGIGADRLLFETEMAPSAGTIALNNFYNDDIVAGYRAIKSGASLICLRGRHFPAQQNSDMLQQVGLKQLICSNPHSYTKLAIELATDKKKRLRATSKDIANSGLEDIAGFAKRFREILLS